MKDEFIKTFSEGINTDTFKPAYTTEILDRIKQLCKAEFTISNLWWIANGSKANLKDLYDNQEYEIFIKPKKVDNGNQSNRMV